MTENELTPPSAGGQAPQPAAARAARSGHILPAVIVAALAVASFIPALGTSFVGDDKDYVLDNSGIHSLINIPSFFTARYWNRPGAADRAYRPIVELSLAVDYAISGRGAAGFRITNLLLHAMVALAVYAVAFQLSRQRLAALIAGALFAAHPAQAEVVNVIKNRGDLLGTLFCLLSWLAFIQMVDRAHARQAAERPPAGPSGLRGLITGIVFFALALCSKEIAITLPILLLIYTAAMVPVGWRGWAGAQTLVWWVALWGYMALSLAALEKFSGAVTSGRLQGAPSALTGLDTSQRALVALKSIGVYLWMLIYPNSNTRGLSDIVQVPTGVGAWPVIVSGAALAVLVTACVLIFRRHRMAAFALAWLPITLLPVSNVVPLVGSAPIVGHRLYFPAVGWCLLLGAVVAGLGWRRLGRTPYFAGAYRVAVVILALLVALYAVRSFTRSLAWERAPGVAAVRTDETRTTRLSPAPGLHLSPRETHRVRSPDGAVATAGG